ncbi:MAG: bifunctional phosphoribosylaminoimidazolecarboxamide formyltransferase/IMP cyclohydrolase [Candidatus Hydrothermarchaeota archaeon]
MRSELPVKKALISVYDKTGIVEFSKGLTELGIEILSTGGTAKLLKKSGIPVTEVSDYTGFPEILNGRVKTLHPKVHAGILWRRNRREDEETIIKYNIPSIDMVVVNLYPFEEKIKKKDSLEDILENIDIGGPALIRAAAKNFENVVVLVNPSKYDRILKELRENGTISRDTRYELFVEAFQRTAEYDAQIYNYFLRDDYPDRLILTYEKKEELRYGENPHQTASLFIDKNAEVNFSKIKKIHGKKLSYNNILDIDASLRLIYEFRDDIACVIVKHLNPCGGAKGKKLSDAYRKALSTDPVSAFGGIVALSREVDEETAIEINKQFIEVVSAPGFSDDALNVLKQKKNIRLIDISEIWNLDIYGGKEIRGIIGGLLCQSYDQIKLKREDLKVVSHKKPTEEEIDAMMFAWKFIRNVRSNAIVLAIPNQVIGIGAGQTSRVDSVRIAVEKARMAGFSTEGSVLASDAFFPFRDGIDVAAEAGITAIIQPGGSIRDEEVIRAVNEHEISMVFTGVRHLSH